MSETNYQYIIGMDPSANNFGCAIKTVKTGKLKLYTGEFQQAINWINTNCDLSKSLAVIENSGLVSPAFKVWSMMQREIEYYTERMVKYELFKAKQSTINFPKPTIEGCRSQFSIAITYGQRVGGQKEICAQTVNIFEAAGVKVLEVSPSKRQSAKTAREKAGKAKVNIFSLRCPTKTNAAEFYELTGYGKEKGESSNEHNRDAAILIYNLEPEDILKQLRKPGSYPSATNSVELFSNNEELLEFYKDDDLSHIVKSDEDIYLNTKNDKK